MAHTKPDLSILELSAGTGGVALPFFSSTHGGLFNYTFSGPDPAILESAKERLQAHRASIEFKVLDIEQDPSGQGFKDNAFDLIIASNALYSAQSLDKALANARKLLNPGGKLCLIEVTNPGMRLRTILSCLPSWLR